MGAKRTSPFGGSVYFLFFFKIESEQFYRPTRPLLRRSSGGAPSPTTPPPPSPPSQAPPMAGPAAPAGADPDIPPKEAPPRAPEESIDAAQPQPQRLQRVRANLRLPDRPFAAPSAAHDAGLRALRLLDFVRLDLPSSGAPRPDLVAELIANYSSARGWSSVRGNQIEVSLESFARALRLPPHGSSTPAAILTDTSAVTSAVREFTKVYIGAPATDAKRRLPSAFFVKNVKRGPEYTTELLWELLKQEMEHLVQSESADWVSYYAAFLQRLIWVEMPELFQPPPPSELSVEVAPAALLVRKEHGNSLATIHENQKRCSESSHISGSKQIDMASKKIDLASEVNIAASKMIQTMSKQLEARTKQPSEKDGDVQAVESLNQALVTKDIETNDIIDRSEVSSKQIDMASKKIGLASKKRKQAKSDKTERRSPRLASKNVDSASRLCLSNRKLDL
uniref:Uncharacterized protein n=1 Tax=Avena sativa TaxID=4498 RepID=A0ACD5ZZW1_AVESA